MLYVTVKLYGKKGVRGEFKEYEKKVLDIFKKYGGEIVVAYAPAMEDNSEDVPDEIQVLRIADRSQFNAFMQDPERLKMADERTSVIRKTEVYLSEEIIEY
jgi:uncharacterized protein (DUF1330 family)